MNSVEKKRLFSNHLLRLLFTHWKSININLNNVILGELNRSQGVSEKHSGIFIDMRLYLNILVI